MHLYLKTQKSSCSQFHNITQIHNSVMWDKQYSTECSRIQIKYEGTFHGILFVSHYNVIDLNNGMLTKRKETNIIICIQDGLKY
jgi:hypothetical protein